jgi:hypothetical protein
MARIRALANRENFAANPGAEQTMSPQQDESKSVTPNYHSRLRAKACPEPDLRYRSKASALARSLNAMYVISFRGLNFDV